MSRDTKVSNNNLLRAKIQMIIWTEVRVQSWERKVMTADLVCSGPSGAKLKPMPDSSYGRAIDFLCSNLTSACYYTLNHTFLVLFACGG